MKYVSVPWSPLEAALSILKVSFLIKNSFRDGINKKEKNAPQYRILSLLKVRELPYGIVMSQSSFTVTNLPYILDSNPHPNLIRTSFCRFLKRKKKFVRGSNPHRSFNRPLPTRQTD